MSIKTETYLRKPIKVDAIRVTEENLFEVSMWCQGTIIWRVNPEGGKPGVVDYIRVHVHSPQTDRQKHAYVGDWVLYSKNRGYKVYSDRAFKNTFSLEPTAELKKAWGEFTKTMSDSIAEAKQKLGDIDVLADPDMPQGDFAVVNPDGSRVHYRGGTAEPEAICDTCGAPKSTHVLGELCNNNCGGRVIANPKLESQAPH